MSRFSLLWYFQFIQLFPVAILSHIFSLYSHDILSVVFTPPVGYSRPPSAVNDSTVTKHMNSGNHALKKCPNYLFIRLRWSIGTGYVSMVTYVGIRSPPWSLPAPPRRPSLVSLSCIFFQLLQSRPCLFEIRSLLRGHSVGTYLVRTKPPITSVMIIFLWCQMVDMIFVRQIIHLSAKFFGSTNLKHSTAELLISYKSVMDTLEKLLLALFRRLATYYSLSPGFFP